MNESATIATETNPWRTCRPPEGYPLILDSHTPEAKEPIRLGWKGVRHGLEVWSMMRCGLTLTMFWVGLKNVTRWRFAFDYHATEYVEPPPDGLTEEEKRELGRKAFYAHPVIKHFGYKWETYPEHQQDEFIEAAIRARLGKGNERTT